MSELDIWRIVPYLTVNEAMNLILSEKPVKYTFDFMEEKNIPEKAIPIISDIKIQHEYF